MTNAILNTGPVYQFQLPIFIARNAPHKIVTATAIILAKMLSDNLWSFCNIAAHTPRDMAQNLDPVINSSIDIASHIVSDLRRAI